MFHQCRLNIFSRSLVVWNYIYIFCTIRVFFHGHWQLTGQQGKKGDHLLFHSITSTRSRTFRHLFTTLHVRQLSHISNGTACIFCQTATRWYLTPYQITIWLIDERLQKLVLERTVSSLLRKCFLKPKLSPLCYNPDLQGGWNILQDTL